MKLFQDRNSLIELLPRSGTVFIHGASATPTPLLEALVQNADRFEGLELLHLHTAGKAEYAAPDYAKNFRVTNLFVGENLRSRLDYDRVDYLPCFLSEIPLLFQKGKKPLHAAIVQISPPDAHGYCSLGTSVDVARAAVEHAPLVLAWINPKMPRTLGDGIIHESKIAAAWTQERDLPESICAAPSPAEEKIGAFVASLVEDGATLQMGIGSIPNAALRSLRSHRHLGIHTEMFSDGVVDLVESGAIDNSRKRIHRGKIVTGFVTGTKRLYDFVNDNPGVAFLGSDYVNRSANIARNPKVTAINSAVEVDLTGQVCADSIGSRVISGVGGQMDFIRGAMLSEGGKAIIAITSRTKKGQSRIVSFLKQGAGVVTTRAHVHYVITEYGIADLYGKTLGERTQALLQIAHPDDREELARAYFAQRK